MRWNRLSTSLGVLGALVLTSSCASDPIAPAATRTPAAMAIAYGNDQAAAAGSQLLERIGVQVTDEEGRPLRGVSVSFAATGGGGSVESATDLTDTEGFASTAWTLGSGPGLGAQLATATITGTMITPVTFTARAVTAVVKGAGDGQAAEVGWKVAEAPTVVIRDAAGEPVAGMTVWWTVTGGGGRIDAPTSVTDAEGAAAMPWTLGFSVGNAQTLQASLSPLVATSFSASAVLTSASLYIQAGDNQAGVGGADLALPASVLVTTAETEESFGVPVEGVEVRWEVVEGGGSTPESTSLTNALGVASVRWALGDSPGTNIQRLQASVTGVAAPPVVFVANGSPSSTPLVGVSLIAGDKQTGDPDALLAQPLVIEVTDLLGRPVPGVEVEWHFNDPCDSWGMDWGSCGPGTQSAVTSSGTTWVTDAAGRARAQMRTGTQVGRFQTSVYVRPSGPAATFDFQVTAPGS